jgi:hypothetical protein
MIVSSSLVFTFPPLDEEEEALVTTAQASVVFQNLRLVVFLSGACPVDGSSSSPG